MSAQDFQLQLTKTAEKQNSNEELWNDDLQKF
jgi:hypothetical protein